MPRTIESIVSSHQAATARRRAGKSPWEVTIKLKNVLADYKAVGDALTAEQAVDLSNRIALLLKSGVPAAWRHHEHANYSMDFEHLFERFEQACAADFTSSSESSDSPCDIIDCMLDELYDWGDRYRVWLG